MRRCAPAAAAAACMAMFGGAPTVAAADWVTHGGNPGHTSFAPDLRPPFARAWTAQLDGRGVFGPPVVAAGRLYVSTQDLQGRGTDVTAFDPRTGKRLWQTLAAGDEGQIAYGDGRLYVLGEVLSALDARTGARVWSREAEPGIPTPGPGVVIVPTGLAADGGIAVIDGATGAIRWATSFRNSGATPASDGRRVYATWACGRVVAMDIATGAVVWEAPCLVPAGRIEAELDGDRIHVRGITTDDVLDIATGRALGRISSMAYGAYGDGEIYSVTGDITPSETNFQRFYPWAGQRLEAHARGDLRELWRFSDGSVSYDPLAVAGAVVLPTEQALYALAAHTGRVVWRDPVKVNRGGLAAGDGMLYATSGMQLLAYRSAPPLVKARRLRDGRVLVTVTHARPGALVRVGRARTRANAAGRARLKVRVHRLRVTIDGRVVKVRS